MASIEKTAEGKFLVRWRDDGRKQRMKTFYGKYEANDFRKQIEFGEREEPASVEMLFNTYADQWTERYAKHELSPASQLKASNVLKYHLRPAIGKVRLVDLRRSHLLELRAKLKDSGLANKTVNDVETWAKTMVNTAVSWGMVPLSPWVGMKKLKVVIREFNYWTVDERDRFLNSCRRIDPDFAELVLVATWTGLRRGELRALAVSDLEFDRRMIRVGSTYCTALKATLDRTKGGGTDWVPMAQAVHDALSNRQLAKGADCPVFKESLLTYPCRRLRRLCRQAEVKELRFHDLRHTAASIWVMAGKPLYTVQRLMRHKSIQMTERYAHLSPDYLAGAAELDGATNVRSAAKTVPNPA